MDEKIENVLIKDLKKAYKNKEVPVAALIVFNNKIISHSYNKRLRNKDVTAHAEVLAIKKAAKKIGDWRLNDCDLYVTLEPFAMCNEIIKESRIKNVFYYVSRNDDKKGYNKTECKLLTKNISDSFQQYLTDFFKYNTNR